MADRTIGTVPPQTIRRLPEATLELGAPETARDVGISSVAGQAVAPTALTGVSE